MPIQAVILAVGGVVRRSPGAFLRQFETTRGLPSGVIRQIVDKSIGRTNGPQQRLERGEILLDEFCRIFDGEFASRGLKLSTAQIMREMAQFMTPRPEMVVAIGRMKASGLRVAALTNSWRHTDDPSPADVALREQFDVYVDSTEVGMRKPDPRIYRLACERLGVEPKDTVFVDESGRYLKAARKVGMVTIQFRNVEHTLEALERLLGVGLRGADSRANARGSGAGDGNHPAQT